MIEQKTLAEIVRRVVETAQPEKIILFGSAARDEMGPNSGAGLSPLSFLRKQESSRPAPSAHWIPGQARNDANGTPGYNTMKLLDSSLKHEVSDYATLIRPTLFG